MPARAPLAKYKNLERTGNLRTYFRGNIAPIFGSLNNLPVDLGVPSNYYDSEFLDSSETNGSPPWKSYIPRVFTANAPVETTPGGGEGGGGDVIPGGSITSEVIITFSKVIPSASFLVSTATSGFSFCIRFLFIAFPRDDQKQTIFINGTFEVNGYSLVAYGDADGGTNQYLYFATNDGGTPVYTKVSNDTISLDTWYTVGVKMNSDNSVLKVFLNGVSQNPTPAPESYAISTPTFGSSWLSSGKASPGNNMYGKIAEFIFYDSLLPDSLFTNCFTNALFG